MLGMDMDLDISLDEERRAAVEKFKRGETLIDMSNVARKNYYKLFTNIHVRFEVIERPALGQQIASWISIGYPRRRPFLIRELKAKLLPIDKNNLVLPNSAVLICDYWGQTVYQVQPTRIESREIVSDEYFVTIVGTRGKIQVRGESGSVSMKQEFRETVFKAKVSLSWCSARNKLNRLLRRSQYRIASLLGLMN